MTDENEKRARKRSTSREKKLKIKENLKKGLFDLSDQKASTKKVKHQSSDRSGYQLPSMYAVPKENRGRNTKSRSPMRSMDEGSVEEPSVITTNKSTVVSSQQTQTTIPEHLNRTTLRQPSIVISPSSDSSLATTNSNSGFTYTSRISQLSIHTAPSILSHNDPLVKHTNVVIAQDYIHTTDEQNHPFRNHRDTTDESSEHKQSRLVINLFEEDSRSIDSRSREARSRGTAPTAVDEEQESSPTSKHQKRKKIKWCMVAIVGILAVVGTTVGVVVSLTNKKDTSIDTAVQDNKTVNNETMVEVINERVPQIPPLPSPTISPVLLSPVKGTTLPPDTIAFTNLPSPSPSTNLLEFLISSLITNVSLASPQSTDALQDQSSPQYQALIWVADILFNEEVIMDETLLLQKFALASFYYATSGQNWYTRAGWLDATIPECDGWFGVDCFQDGFHVDNLVFASDNNFVGTLPNELALLTKLKLFSVSDSPDLVGTLPSDFLGDGRIEMKSILISNCSITGKIPTVIGHVTTLENIVLSKNKLTGTLPSELWLLTKLKILELENNEFIGTIPADLGKLTRLKHLDLSQNSFSGSIPMGLPASLLEFSFHDNQVTGGFDFMMSLTSLTNLYGTNNTLDKALPTFLGQLSALKSLILDENQIPGTIPADLGLSTSFMYLELKGNLLTGGLSLDGLMNVSYLSLAHNEFQGTIPTNVGLMTNLVHFDISQNSIHGKIPTEIGLLTRLSHLNVASNFLAGSIPTQTGLMFNFYDINNPLLLDLSFNSLTGLLPPELGNMKGLWKLILEHNLLKGPLPEYLFNLSLDELYLGYNQLTGTLPAKIGFATHLKVLSLEHNRFRGTIPVSFFSLAALKVFRTEGNLLTGTVPETLCLSTPLGRENDENTFTVECPTTCSCCDVCITTLQGGNVSVSR